jgi:hypothetical protein
LRKKRTKIDRILNRILRKIFVITIDDLVRQLRELGCKIPVTSATGVSYHIYVIG